MGAATGCGYCSHLFDVYIEALRCHQLVNEIPCPTPRWLNKVGQKLHCILAIIERSAETTCTVSVYCIHVQWNLLIRTLSGPAVLSFRTEVVLFQRCFLYSLYKSTIGLSFVCWEVQSVLLSEVSLPRDEVVYRTLLS